MSSSRQSGFAIITVLILVVVLGVMITAYFYTTNIELSTNRATTQSVNGFYAAEAGLNLYGEEIRQIFTDDRTPTGTSPTGANPCQGANLGSGDFACKDHSVNGMSVKSYVIEDPSNTAGGTVITIPQTELFGGLSANELKYSVFSNAIATNNETRSSALLEMTFRSRLVPLFQFAAFYDKDLEINPGPNMFLDGRIHVNGDLYLSPGANLYIGGQVTVAESADGTRGGTLFRRRKDNNDCTGTVRVNNRQAPHPPVPLPTNVANTTEPAINCSGAIAQATLNAWNNQIQTGVDYLRVPDVSSFNPGNEYWQKADLRIVYNVADDTIFVPEDVEANVSGATVTYTYTRDANRTTALNNCAVLRDSQTFFDNRQQTNPADAARFITMLEVDIRGLLDCVHNNRANAANNLLGLNRGIDETTHNGLVIHLTVNGPNSGGINTYGVRLFNGASLSSTVAGAPAIRGLTVVTDQAVYVQGDYNLNAFGGNNNNWRPAAVIADSLNILSNAWRVGNVMQDARSRQVLGNRPPTATTVNAAFVAGTDTTGGSNGEGTAGRGVGSYNGGLENYPRFHENWSGIAFTYRGSFISLGRPQHVNGVWPGTGGRFYNAPTRDWGFDLRFNNPANLPPLSPRFVLLRQELFVRDFDQ